MMSRPGSTPCSVTCREMLNIFLLFMLSSLLTGAATACTRRRSHCPLPRAGHVQRAQPRTGAQPTWGLQMPGPLTETALLARSLLTQREVLVCLGFAPRKMGRMVPSTQCHGWLVVASRAWCHPLQPPCRRWPHGHMRHQHTARGWPGQAGGWSTVLRYQHQLDPQNRGSCFVSTSSA